MGKLKFRLAEVAVALLIVSLIFPLIDRVQLMRRYQVPASQWIAVNSIYVPDFAAGSDPLMTYDRRIIEEFQGFWVVEVQQHDPASGAFILRCSGSGVNDYEPQDYIPENVVSWSWFIGKPCNDLPPGDYRLRTSWVLKRPDWPEKQIVAYSNMFKVLPN